MFALIMTIIFYAVFAVTAVFVFLHDTSRWVGLIAALVHPFMAIPIALFVFYKGYFGVVMGKGYFTFYKLGETLIISIGEIIRFLCFLFLAVFVPWTLVYGLRDDELQKELPGTGIGSL